MVFKRGLSFKEGNDIPLLYQDNQQHPSQRLKFTKCQCKERLWLQAYSGQLEDLIRKVVREEIQQVIQHSSHSISRLLPSQAKPCESRKFKLQFEGNLPRKLFTGNKIEAEGPSPIKLFLHDAASGHLVKYGPLSSIKVKLVVLHGHFKAENWTQHEFDNNIVFERDGKRPLLVGQHVVSLQDGIGSVGDVCITDNSSWERSKMFRLGAKVEAREELVMEAVSSPFEVKDRRGETYQKHKIPCPEDEVWRLCWIAKDGKICKRLAEHQIYKVKDLVTQYYLDECLLRQILNVSPKKWQGIIQHATSCFLSNHSDSPSDITTHMDSPIVQQACMQPFCHDQQGSSQLSHTSEQSHLLDQYMNLNDYSLEDLFSGSCNDHINRSFLDDYKLSHFPSQEASSSWFPTAQSMVEEGHKYYMDSSYNPDMVMQSKSTPSVNALDCVETKDVWKILAGHDEAVVKKGKFPC